MTTLQLPRTYPEFSRVPLDYADLLEVFSKKNAASLQPHRPYDCAIDVLPGMCPPRGRLFSLSATERKVMEDYIQESQASCFFSPTQHHQLELVSSLLIRKTVGSDLV